MGLLKYKTGYARGRTSDGGCSRCRGAGGPRRRRTGAVISQVLAKRPQLLASAKGDALAALDGAGLVLS